MKRRNACKSRARRPSRARALHLRHPCRSREWLRAQPGARSACCTATRRHRARGRRRGTRAAAAGIPVRSVSGARRWPSSPAPSRHQGVVARVRAVSVCRRSTAVARRAARACWSLRGSAPGSAQPRGAGAHRGGGRRGGGDHSARTAASRSPRRSRRSPPGRRRCCRSAGSPTSRAPLPSLKEAGYWSIGLDPARRAGACSRSIRRSASSWCSAARPASGRWWRSSAIFCVSIPMTGGVESLNASVAAAVVLYESAATLEACLTGSGSVVTSTFYARTALRTDARKGRNGKVMRRLGRCSSKVERLTCNQ